MTCNKCKGGMLTMITRSGFGAKVWSRCLACSVLIPVGLIKDFFKGL